MKDNGKMIYSMEMEVLYKMMEIVIKGNGIEESSRDLGCLSIVMGINIKDNGLMGSKMEKDN